MGDLTRIRLSLRWIEAVLAKLAVLTHFDRWGVRPITQRRFVPFVILRLRPGLPGERKARAICARYKLSLA